MIKSRLQFIYGEEEAEKIYPLLMEKINNCKKRNVRSETLFSEKDSILITYGDQIKSKQTTPLAALNSFVNKKLDDAVSAVHLLPFYPYSSDGGFSVIDFKAVSPDMGNWDDVSAFKKELMFDAVFNHISAKSEWFIEWKNGNNKFNNFFLDYSPEEAKEIENDLKKVTRPRPYPLLTPFETSKGIRKVWTTFSEDQIDTNFSNPEVLLELIDALLFYFEKGAKYIRIDAVPFLWKEIGTTCAHHPKTHEIVKLFRTVAEELGIDAVIITESNVPHKDNISYFGNGSDEAHMVYNFTLAPLILHANYVGTAKHLNNWSSGLEPLGEKCTFFNFTATHDGIGLMPLKGVLPDSEIDLICQKTLERDGRINNKTNPDGTVSPYEANITWTSALENDELSDELLVRKTVSSHLAMCSFPGVPGLYFHNFLGTKNWQEGLAKTQHNRDLNRRKFDIHELENILSTPFEKQVFESMVRALKVRRSEKAFNPKAEKKDVMLDEAIWSFERVSLDGQDKILVLYNLTNETREVALPEEYQNCNLVELLEDRTVSGEMITCLPYSIQWLKSS